MSFERLYKEREGIEKKLSESGLADACVKVAEKLGDNRKSHQEACYTNIDYLYEIGDLEIDCNIGQNMQGNGCLKVNVSGRRVFEFAIAYDTESDDRLPVVKARCVEYKVVAYEPGAWEKAIVGLSGDV